MSLPRIFRRSVPLAAALLVGSVVTVNCGAASTPSPTSTSTVTDRSLALPALTVTQLVTGLNLPWDLTFTPDGTMLFDQRSGIIRARLPSGVIRPVAANLSDLWVASETGLMGMVVDPDFAKNRQFYTCQGHVGPTDVRVIKWTINATYTAATRVGAPLVTGIGTSTGRHGGCRLRFDNNKNLYIGTGDAAIGTNPQNLQALNGKVLRVTTSGAPAPGNPFLSSTNGRTRLIYTYGHRNVQGLALRPGTNQMWSVEQGTYRDDEVNKLVAGKNYGYNPVPKKTGDPSYNESVLMTDPSLPNVQAAVYSTGDPTLALSGGTFLSGAQWGSLDGAFVAAALKDTSLRALTLTAGGALVSEQSIPQLDNTYGRLRSPQLGPDGALYITTGDGDGHDQILRVTPTRATGDAACLNSRPALPSPVAAVSVGGHTLAFVVATDQSVQFRDVDAASKAFTNLAGKVLYGPAVASWDGKQRLDVFATGVNHNVYHRFRENSRWSPWENLGFQSTSSPAVLSTAFRQLNVFARGTDGALWTRRFDGRQWHPWSRLGGGLSSAPAATGGSDPRVGVRGTNGYLYQMHFNAAGRPTTGFTLAGYGICSAPGLSGSSPWQSIAYVRSNGSTDVRMNGITYPLGGVVLGSVALVAGSTPLGFAALGRGTTRNLYIFDARKGVPGAGWRNLGGTLL